MPEEFKDILRDLLGGNVGAAQEIVENQNKYEADSDKKRRDFSRMLAEVRKNHCNDV